MVLLSGLFAIILHYAFTYTGLSMTDGSKTVILKQLGADIFNLRYISAFLLISAGIAVANRKNKQ